MEKEKNNAVSDETENDFCFKQLMADAQIRQAFFVGSYGGFPMRKSKRQHCCPPVLRNSIRKTSLEFWMFGSN